MKKYLCILLSVIMAASAFSVIPAAAKKKTAAASLKSKSVTLKITTKKGNTVYGSATIKINKIKGVKIKKTTFKSSDKKIVKVSKSGKVTAVKKGKATVSVSVKYTLKKRTYTKKMSYKVTVKDERKKTPVTPTEPATETQEETEVETDSTEPASEDTSTEPSESQTATEPDPTETESYTETVTETEADTTPYSGEAVSKRLNDVPEIQSGSNITDKDFLYKLSQFSNKLYVMSAKEESGNYAMSPTSVYMAMAMLYYVGDEGVKADVKELVGMTDAQIAKTGELFKSLTKVYKSWGLDPEEREVVSRLNLTNSIWLNEGENADEATLKKLADELYCHAYETPFKTNNKAANKAIREFIKEQTNGLIDKDFNLYPSTVFALINTLYFKDIWDDETEKLRTEEKVFTTPSGKIKTEFLYGKYIDGQAQETTKCLYFYTTTAHGYKIKFILPKDGYSLKKAMSEVNLNTVNSDNEFDAVDNKGIKHLTRCIFPSFKIESDTKLKDILQQNGLLKNSFSLFNSPLFEDRELEVSDIKHTSVIKVNDEGVEGAAVTIIMVKDGAVFHDDEPVYHDFVLDRNFGFIITDPNDVVLFEGQVTNPKQ